MNRLFIIITDDSNWVENNTVVKEKKELLEKYQITVWRFHDYWHRMKPDGVLHGIIVKDGLADVIIPKKKMYFSFLRNHLIEIIRHLKEYSANSTSALY